MQEGAKNVNLNDLYVLSFVEERKGRYRLSLFTCVEVPPSQTNATDIFSSIPRDQIAHIFSYLDATTLCQVSKVSKKFYFLRYERITCSLFKRKRNGVEKISCSGKIREKKREKQHSKFRFRKRNFKCFFSLFFLSSYIFQMLLEANYKYEFVLERIDQLQVEFESRKEAPQEIGKCSFFYKTKCMEMTMTDLGCLHAPTRGTSIDPTSIISCCSNGRCKEIRKKYRGAEAGYCRRGRSWKIRHGDTIRSRIFRR